METLQAFGAVAFVLSLLLAVLFALRKRGIASFAVPFSVRQGAGKEMEVLERVPLGPQHFLHLVRVGETKCLVTTSPGRVPGPHVSDSNKFMKAGLSIPSSIPLTGGLSTPMQIVILLTVLTLLPAIVMSLTPFLRISIVLHFLRQAIGTQTVPSNQVLTGMALFLSPGVIEPTAAQIYEKAWQPMERGEFTAAQAFESGGKPLKKFLGKYVREKDLKLFLEITRSPAPRNVEDLDLKVLAPAYILSEMRAGFQIGAVLFLPFLLVDIVVASVTLSVGMVQLPPAMVSAPFKILLFVLVDGWNLTVGSLMKGFV